MSIEIIDNLISPLYLEILQTAVFDPNFVWHYYDATAGGDNSDFSWIEDENTEESDFFTHKISKDANNEIVSFEPLIYALSNHLGYHIHISRIKTNLMLPTFKKNANSYNRPHIDHPAEQAKTLLFYINDADGDTFFFDKKFTSKDPGKLEILERITPKAGQAVLFDSNRYHASSIPTQNRRAVINVIFWPRNLEEKKNPFPPLPPDFKNPKQIQEFFNKAYNSQE